MRFQYIIYQKLKEYDTEILNKGENGNVNIIQYVIYVIIFLNDTRNLGRC